MANATPSARRVNHGRGHAYEIGGRRVDGVTQIIGDGIPKPALVDWAARVTAGYAVDHWDELEAQLPSQRLRTLERCRWDTTKTAAAKGTTIHDLAMRLARGEEVDVPEPITGYVDAYLRFVDEWQPHEILVEVPVFHRTLQYAGTLDLIAELADGWTWLIDWKSGGTGIYREAAVQLAAYRHAEFYLDHDGNEHPLPPVDFAGCVWLRADGYDLYRVAADDRAFAVFRYAREIARFCEDPKDLYVSEAMTPPVRSAA